MHSMTDKAPVNAPAIAVLPLLLIWMAVLLPVYHPNMGGGGLALPQNILAWSVMALTTLIVTFTVCLGRTRLSLTPTARLLLLGIAVLALPLLYTRPEWREDALWRCAGLLGSWLFYVACLQLRLTARQRNLLLYGLLFAVGVQALLAALQLFAPALAWVSPNGSRVYGVFQQPNVLGSFIATGLALALWLLLAPLSAPTRRQLPLLALLAAFSALLVLIQSRAAWLGSALAAALLLWRFARQHPAVSRWAGGALLLGVALGTTVLLTGFGMETSTVLHDYEFSNGARLTMLHDVGAMILAKPLLGWGYGGFEYSFAHFRLQAMPWREVLEVAGHPHNEILLWWVEGGLPALAGYRPRRRRAAVETRLATGSRAAGRCARRAVSGAAANAGTHPAGIPFLSVCAALAGVSAAAGAAGRPNRRVPPAAVRQSPEPTAGDGGHRRTGDGGLRLARAHGAHPIGAHHAGHHRQHRADAAAGRLDLPGAQNLRRTISRAAGL